MADRTRLRRIGEQIKIELSSLMRDNLDDPRLTFVSITYIEVARDMSHSKVFVTYLGDEEERADIVDTLNDLSKHYRYELGKRMKLRTVPTLKFLYDETIEKGANLQRKIEKISEQENHSNSE